VALCGVDLEVGGFCAKLQRHGFPFSTEPSGTWD
jgi:hypothetical protein